MEDASREGIKSRRREVLRNRLHELTLAKGVDHAFGPVEFARCSCTGGETIWDPVVVKGADSAKRPAWRCRACGKTRKRKGKKSVAASKLDRLISELDS